MNPFMHHSAKLLAVGGIVTSAVLGAIHPAWALTQEEVIEQLQRIPVFTIVDSNGVSLTVEFQEEESEEAVSVAPIFINRADAESFLTRIQDTESELPEDIRVALSPLGPVYAASVDEENPENQLALQYVPSPDEQQSAVEVLQGRLEERGEDPSVISRFLGAPVFASCNDEGNCLSPFFFSYGDYQEFIDNLGEEGEQIPEEFQPGVVTLQSLIESIESAESADRLWIIPSPETRQEIEGLQGVSEDAAEEEALEDPAQ
ncbi:MAG: Tic22 family protein [Elainellaceae cyanobacterium]